MFKLEFKVVRHRLSVTQGEAEVFCNGQSIVRFGDTIRLGGTIDVIDGYGSTIADGYFIRAALRYNNYEIIECVTCSKEKTTNKSSKKTTFDSLEVVHGEDEEAKMRRLYGIRTEDLTGENFDY